MRFEGSVLDVLCLLVHLNNKYNDQCVLLQVLHENWGHKIHWNDVSLLFVEGSLRYPNNKSLENHATTIARCKFRFVLTPLMIVDPSYKYMHANMVIYDTKKQTLERYESYSSTPSGYGSMIPLDESLRQLASEINPRSRYIQPVKVPVQLLQEIENKMNEADPAGYCLAYSALYADLRLQFALRDPEAIPELLYVAATRHPSSMTQYIRDYAKSATEIKASIDPQDIQSIIDKSNIVSGSFI
jgi:hypothetical protein